MEIYDENFDYIDVKNYPVYMYDGTEEIVEEVLETKNDAVAFFKIDNRQDRKTLKYSYDGKELYLIRHKDGTEEFNDKNIKELFYPEQMNKRESFILGIGSLSGTIKDSRLYRYDLKTGEVKAIKEFPDTAEFLITLIENDRKLIYSTLNPYENINEYGNKGRKIFVMDLKTTEIKELKLNNKLFEEFYYSHEIRNINKKLIDKFEKLK